ncbi:MAG: hypothetical protein Q9219_006687 [cf. Caloplaca sp. 3 TL-2023]
MVLYFGYGSNLWLAQMSLRCPSSTYVGIARIKGYRWIINSRGYANIVATPETPASEVYGFVYRLTSADEARLDKNEGTHLVPPAYTKEMMRAEVWVAGDQISVAGVGDDGLVTGKVEELLVYIDRVRTVDGIPRDEYVERINMGIVDAMDTGIPRGYIDDVLRRYIPDNRS